MMLAIAQLPERSTLFVGGPEAEAFLNNLLTCEVKGLGAGEARYGALLTPQGKILYDMFVTPAETGFLLDCPAAGLDDLVRRLTMYRLRSKIEIAKRPDLSVAAAWGGGPPSVHGAIYLDPRFAGLGHRVIGSSIEDTASVDAYHAHRIALGIADWDADMGLGQLFPHEANFDQLDGVSFSKGCYVGQEVVSRMQHRGTGARNRILPVRFEGASPAQDTDVVAGERKIGALLSSSGSNALALLRLDKVEQAYAAGEAVTAGGRPLAIEQPPWAGFAVPGRGAAA